MAAIAAVAVLSTLYSLKKLYTYVSAASPARSAQAEGAAVVDTLRLERVKNWARVADELRMRARVSSSKTE